MSEQEFELYLKLLSRCLGLTSRQREQIADELRDHLEERLGELARTGVSREQAIFQAIDEFGDAAALAGHFTTIAHLKRRRFLMRLSLGSVAALVVIMLAAVAFWPENHAIQGPPQLFAGNKPQPKPAAKTPDAVAPKTELLPTQSQPVQRAHNALQKTKSETHVATEHPLSSDIGQNPRIEEALDQNVDFAIEPQPLKDAIDFIAQRYQIPILPDTKVLEDASVDTSAEVRMPYSGMKLRNLLKLLIGQGSQPLSYAIEDGILRISTVEQIRQYTYVVVYDCRDLIHLRSLYPGSATDSSPKAQAPGTNDGGTMFSVGPNSALIARQFGGGSGGGPAKANKKVEHSAKNSCAPDEIPLIRVIKYAGDPADWDEQEGAGPKITEIGGLLVVNQNPMVHEQIKRILADLRRMRKEGAFATIDGNQAGTRWVPAPAVQDKFAPKMAPQPTSAGL
jgi:hypothetical protein